MSVTFPGTANWRANCTISDYGSVVGIHGVPSVVLAFILGLLIMGLLLSMRQLRDRRKAAPAPQTEPVDDSSLSHLEPPYLDDGDENGWPLPVTPRPDYSAYHRHSSRETSGDDSLYTRPTQNESSTGSHRVVDESFDDDDETLDGQPLPPRQPRHLMR